VIPSEVTTALKAVTSAFGGTVAEGPMAPATPATPAAAAPDVPAVEQETLRSIPQQLGVPELAAQQQNGQETEGESLTNPDQPVPISMPPGSPNGTAG
jgi:hypothetical protein